MENPIIINVTCPPRHLWIGREAENNYRPQTIECAEWLEKYPGASIVAYYQPYATSDPYPLVLTADGTKRIWHPTATELVKGNGELQIVLMLGDVVGTSAIIPTRVDRSLISSADHPAADAPSWTVQVVQDVTEQADRAEEATSHYPKVVNGVWYVWSVQAEDFVSTGIEAQGDTGDSAYEEAVALGFVGTEAEWIASLKGEKGDKGDVGALADLDASYDETTKTLSLGTNATSLAIEDRLSTTSTNPVQNRIITGALNGKQDKLTAGQNVTISGGIISADVDSAEIAANVTDWLDDNVTPVGSAVVVDSSLAVSGAAADAKVTGDIDSAFRSFVSGGTRSFTVDVASSVSWFGYRLLKGVAYTITNNTAAACTVAVKNKSGVETSLSSGLASGRSISYTPDTDDIVAVGGWFNGTGTFDVYNVGQLLKDEEQSAGIKTVSFKGTFSASDVENNHGYIEQYGRFYSSNYWLSTDYIAIPILMQETNLVIKSTIYEDGGVAFYNSNKECILGISGRNAAKYGFENRYEIIERTVPAPAGTAFVRICYYSYTQDLSRAENLLISGDFGITSAADAGAYTDAKTEVNERVDLCRWHDGTVYVTRNGVPTGSGLHIPNVTNGKLFDRTLLFEDDFTGNSLDTSVWEYEIGYKRNNEPQVYQESNVSVENSNLIITATRENVQAMKGGVLTDFEWTSGSILCTMPYTYGRAEAKILFPSTVGSFGAFWGVGTVGSYPDCGEIDVIENNPNTSNPNNISCGAYGVDGNNAQVSYGRRFLKSYDQRGYHIYAVEITETELQFFIDGDLVSSVDTTSEYMSEFRTPYKWILNLALSPASFGTGYQIPDDVDEYKMYVDWFRFYAP